MPPALLLTLTFLLGAGSAFTVPAYQAMIPDLVPRSQLSSASALGSINVNLARAVGPAIAGVVVASAGRPMGILTRSDLLEFLSARRSQVELG